MTYKLLFYVGLKKSWFKHSKRLKKYTLYLNFNHYQIAVKEPVAFKMSFLKSSMGKKYQKLILTHPIELNYELAGDQQFIIFGSQTDVIFYLIYYT